jgi:Zn-dependent oligopeptidase
MSSFIASPIAAHSFCLSSLNAGLDDEFITTLKRTDENLYSITIDYPTYFRVMEYCSITSTRKALYNAFLCNVTDQQQKLI